MMNLWRFLLPILLLTATAASHAEGPLRAVQVTVDGDPMAIPVISLDNPSDRIVISFDELSEDRRYMRYELIHCDARWKPEGLVDSEFLDGFNVADVDDYSYSQATLVHYVHYRITIPNEQMRITAAGNYIVRVYPEDDPDETLLETRFSVCDFSMRVGAAVTSRTDIDTNESHQQVDVTVDMRDINVRDPFTDLTVVVTQNGRPDNEVILTQPLRVAGDKVYFEHQRPLIFQAGNEYRRFETVSTTYPGMNVDEIVYAAPIYNMVLATDYPRAGTSYLYDQTQNGRFFIREYNAVDPDTEADYTLNHFRLEMPELQGYDIFIDGDLTGRRMDPSSRMVYN
ncbi:MAG: DUF5103 domain-containing protein, partial [Duncaniella sp.]|nr:DUF5103 domain-containing protein [Duncaniella sp.]